MRFFISTLILVVALGCRSQTKYFSAFAGYGFATNPEGYIAAVGPGDSAFYTMAPVDFGGGLNTGISFGWMGKSALGFDVALSYQNNGGSSWSQTTTVLALDEDTNLISGTGDQVFTYDAWSYRFCPSLRVAKPSGWFRPFGQLGPLLMYSGFQRTEEWIVPDIYVIYEEEYFANYTIGAAAKAGVQFQVYGVWGIYAAIDFTMVYSRPTYSKLTKAEELGRNVLPDLSLSERETTYLKELDLATYVYDEHAPLPGLQKTYNFNAVGISIGLTYNL